MVETLKVVSNEGFSKDTASIENAKKIYAAQLEKQNVVDDYNISALSKQECNLEMANYNILIRALRGDVAEWKLVNGKPFIVPKQYKAAIADAMGKQTVVNSPMDYIALGVVLAISDKVKKECPEIKVGTIVETQDALAMQMYYPDKNKTDMRPTPEQLTAGFTFHNFEGYFLVHANQILCSWKKTPQKYKQELQERKENRNKLFSE